MTILTLYIVLLQLFESSFCMLIEVSRIFLRRCATNQLTHLPLISTFPLNYLTLVLQTSNFESKYQEYSRRQRRSAVPVGQEFSMFQDVGSGGPHSKLRQVCHFDDVLSGPNPSTGLAY